MAVDFSKIDEAVDLQGLQKDVEDSKNNFSDVPKEMCIRDSTYPFLTHEIIRSHIEHP